MLPCADVHWKLLPAICRELALDMGKEGMAQSKIAATLGTSSAAVSQYVSGKRGGAKLDSKTLAACKKLAKIIAGGKLTKDALDFEVAKILVIAKRSSLGSKDPCVVCMSPDETRNLKDAHVRMRHAVSSGESGSHHS